MRIGRPSGIDPPIHPVGVRISRARLAAFSLPVLLFQAIEMAWRAYLPRFLTLDIGIALGVVGAILLGARLLDAIADPLIGWMSDTVSTPLGRRKPWMALGAALVPVGALLLFLAPSGTGLTQIVAASLLLHLGYSFIITPHGGWGLELSTDKHQRTRIMGAKVWFGLLGALGLLAVMALMERGFAIPRASQMAVLGWAIALLAPITVVAVILLFKEPADVSIQSKASNLLVLFGSMLRARSMRAILALYVLTGIIDAAAASSFLFLAEDILGLDRWGAALLLVQPVLALATLPIWSRVSARIGRQQTLMIAYGWQGLTAPLLFLIPEGQPVIFAAFIAIRALGWGVDYMLLRAMVADLVDGQAQDMGRLGGIYYGMSSVTLKIAMGVGGGGALWLMKIMASPTGIASADAVRLAYALPATILAPIALLILVMHERRFADWQLPFAKKFA
ncbi:MAG: sodium:galactoside symporter [Sphingomonadales bacterium GWF1_63_6]|nr:MAG: sodium:galactoside symporter [Sphingomonadales bacterium GWF1_63_6]